MGISRQRQIYLTNEVRKYKEWTSFRKIIKDLPAEIFVDNSNTQFYIRQTLEKNLGETAEWRKPTASWELKYVGDEEYVPPEPKADTEASLTDDNHASIDDELSTEASPPDNGKGLPVEASTIVEKQVSGLTSNGKISLSKWCDIGAAMLSAAAAEIRKP
jgi:hypothetical protein